MRTTETIAVWPFARQLARFNYGRTHPRGNWPAGLHTEVFMLVPAMTFAWWLVSMSAAAPPAPAHHPLLKTPSSSATAELATEPRDDARDTDEEDEAQPAEQAETDGESADDTAGTRVHLKVVTPEIVRMAKTFLDLPMGAERSVTIDGHRYVFVLERHYHPPGFVGGPHGWHKGVTVYGTR